MARRQLTVGARGLMGWTGREWLRYHAKTTDIRLVLLGRSRGGKGGWEWRGYTSVAVFGGVGACAYDGEAGGGEEGLEGCLHATVQVIICLDDASVG